MTPRLSWPCPFNCSVVRDTRASLLKHFTQKHQRAMLKLAMPALLEQATPERLVKKKTTRKTKSK